MLPAEFQPPAADPQGERHVREAARERLRRLLDENPGRGSAVPAQVAEPARSIVKEEIDNYNRAAVMVNSPRLPESEALVRWVVDAILYYGPLTPALRDAHTEEVFCDGPHRISVVRGGRHVLTTLAFEDDAHLLATIKKLATDAGRRIDESSPMVEARLPDGARLHAVIPPIARPWPYVTIRRFPARPLRLSELSDEDSGNAVLTEQAAAFLVTALRGGANVLIVGGTGSGKTTLLNGLLAELGGPGQRTVVIEETAELQIQDIPFAVALEGRPPNIEGAGEVGLRPLVKAALRMRPRRIVVGEARGPEAFDLLQAMNTGHEGSLATAHANSPRDGLERLVTMAAQAGERLPDATLRRMVAQAIGLVIHMELDAHGRRRVTEIWELTGMEGDQFQGHAVFQVQGAALRPTGLPSRWHGAAQAVVNGRVYESADAVV